MKNNRLSHLILLLLCLALMVVAPMETFAKRAGFSGLTALADSADTVFWNPAGMTRLGQTLQVQNAVTFLNSDFQVEKSTYEGGDPKSENELLLIPGIYYSQPLNDEWFAGVSLNVPSGIGNDYGKHWSGRYHADETSLVFVSLSPSLAYKLNKEWSFSAGLNLMSVDSESKSRVNDVFSDEDGWIKLEESGFGAGLTLGTLYEPTSSTRIGVTYHSKVDVDLDGSPEFGGFSDLLVLELNQAGLLGHKINVDFEIPQIINVGAFYQINDRYSVTADFLWMDMSKFGIDHVSVGEDGMSVSSIFQDMYGGGVGIGYKLNEKTDLNVGAFYLSSAVDKTEERTLALPLDRIFVLGVGMVRKLENGHTLDVKLDFADLGKSRIDIQDSLVQGDLKGKFDNNYAIILDLNYRFNW